jgi:hypothetical protein
LAQTAASLAEGARLQPARMERVFTIDEHHVKEAHTDAIEPESPAIT